MLKTIRLKKDLSSTRPKPISGKLILEDGTVFAGIKIGFKGSSIGELCFNTSMTGYQEIITDPSYAGQIINFTFPHIGNVGTNFDDNEAQKSFAKGVIINCDISDPSNFRSIQHLDTWLKKKRIPGLCNVDTRALTNKIRNDGALKGGIAEKKNRDDLKLFMQEIIKWHGLNNLDLALEVTCKKIKILNKNPKSKLKIVAIDYGVKQNILNCLQNLNANIIIVPATTPSSEILNYKPDGIFLSNGPGDPKATGKYAIPIIKELILNDLPIFGICLGHQLLSIALGAKTKKMFQGHRGANHPVKNLENSKVEITSQNHGFEVSRKSIPKNIKVTHVSLFDNGIEGIQHKSKKLFSVQYHPEASPGPHDSNYLFKKFKNMMISNA